MTDTAEIRKSYINLISNLIGLPGYDTLVPIDEEPDAYFVVTNVSRVQTARGKTKGTSGMRTGFRMTENRVFLNVDICVTTELGVHSSISVEQFIDPIIDVISEGLNPDGFYIKETKVGSVIPLNLITGTRNIQRMVVPFEHWVSKRNNYPPVIIDNNPAGAEHPTIYAPENLNREWDMLLDSNEPRQSGLIFAPLDPCTLVGGLIDNNPAPAAHHIIYSS